MVGAARGVVPQQRRTPQGRRPQVGDIVQMVDHPLQVTAVTAHRGLPAGLLGRIRRGIVGRIAVGEPVRDDQVDQVGRREALPVGGTLFPGCDDIGATDFLVPLLEHERIGPGFGFRGHIHIDKQVIRAVGLMDGLDFHTLATLDGHGVRPDPLPVHEELEVGFHPGPPGQGFHAGHFTRPGSDGQAQAGQRSQTLSHKFQILYP